MRKALIIGIDYYEDGSHLYGCVNDAHAVKAALERHADGTVNFDIKLLTATGPKEQVTRATLRSSVDELFAGDSEIALFYFAGHGHIDTVGGYLCTSDSKTGDDGLGLYDVLALANESKAINKVIILDSCHSGIAGSKATLKPVAELKEGITVLTASTADQYADEENNSGVFTSLLIDALNGAASNLLGDITPGSVYAHIDQSLGPWEQRPVFKTNVKQFVSLRKAIPPISLIDLQRITEIFPTAGFQFKLDPSYEPEGPNPNTKNTEIFAILQKYVRVNLVVPIDATHMYHAAMGNKSCKLTVLGEHYRRLRSKGRI